jgi:hypothetical protein
LSSWGFTLSPAKFLAVLIDLIAINQTIPTEAGLVKRRRRGRAWIIAVGNVYLRLSHSRILMFPSTAAWQAWECESYHVLHGGGCERLGRDALLVQRLPGQSLLSFLQAGTLTHAMLIGAAHELRRAHALSWTHGDPHLTNILYDGTRAYLIDFETQHTASIAFQERCADDLLVILLDLMGRESSEQWQEWSTALISGYDDPGVLSALAERLHMPKGFELVLWKSRTHYLPQAQLAQRIAQLKRIVTSLAMESTTLR